MKAPESKVGSLLVFAVVFVELVQVVFEQLCYNEEVLFVVEEVVNF